MHARAHLRMVPRVHKRTHVPVHTRTGTRRKTHEIPAIGHFRIYHNTLLCPSKILPKHRFQFVLSSKRN